MIKNKIIIQLFVIGLILLICASASEVNKNSKKFINSTDLIITKDVTENATGNQTEEWWTELPDFKHESVVEKILDFITNIGPAIWPSKPWAGWAVFFVAAYFIIRMTNFTSDYLDDLLWDWFGYRRK